MKIYKKRNKELEKGRKKLSYSFSIYNTHHILLRSFQVVFVLLMYISVYSFPYPSIIIIYGITSRLINVSRVVCRIQKHFWVDGSVEEIERIYGDRWQVNCKCIILSNTDEKDFSYKVQFYLYTRNEIHPSLKFYCRNIEI